MSEAVASSPISEAPALPDFIDFPRSIFAGGGEMGAHMSALDWSQTPLGPVNDWPQSLKTTVSICLASRFPIVVYWGPEYVVLYNDAYSQILGSKHPWALGQTCRVCWAEIWDTIAPMLDSVQATGQATWSRDLLLMLKRFGYPEECYFSFSFSPVRVESGAVGGVFTAVIESTEKVIGGRRLQTLRDLAAQAVAATAEQDIWQITAATLAENARDIPLAVLCEASEESLRVAAAAGIDTAHPLCDALARPGSDLHREAMLALKSGQPAEVHNLNSLFADLPTGPWDSPPHSAMMLPIAAPGQRPSGLLLAAASPAKKVDGAYRTFFDQLAQQVTAYKLIEEKNERLRFSHIGLQRLAAIIDSSDDAIISKDLNGIVTSWNPGAEKMFGYKAEEMNGRPIVTIIPPDLQRDEERILATIARGERIDHFETVRVTKSGQPIEVSLTISPVRDESGRIIGASKIARDITQRNKTARMMHMTEKLASVGRLAATIAHEINNPLEAIANLVYLARVNSGEDTIRVYLSQAEEELSRVSLLTRQTLGFYRETKGMRALDLESLIAPLVAVFVPRARNKAVTIEPAFRDAPEIQAVPGEIRQLVANLLSNSIDAVPQEGRIRVRVSPATERSERGRSGVRITVCDNGPGIPAALRTHLFEPFFTTKRDVGTGLGLWVCKSIVEKHDGTIRLKSSTEPGRSWTLFTVFLPLQPDKDAAEPDVPPDFSLSSLGRM